MSRFTHPMVRCEPCGGKGIDPGSLLKPEACQHCAGHGDILAPEEVERIARRQVERAKSSVERLPDGYFNERVWRFGA